MSGRVGEGLKETTDGRVWRAEGLSDPGEHLIARAKRAVKERMMVQIM